MKREEKLQEAADRYSDVYKYDIDIDHMNVGIAFMIGAEWADNNPPQGVVNLNDIWHDASKKPIYGRDIIAVDFDGHALSGTFRRVGDNKGVFYNCFCLCDWSVVSKWMYVFDILPGGGQ